jgi:hypothetical protein
MTIDIHHKFTFVFVDQSSFSKIEPILRCIICKKSTDNRSDLCLKIRIVQSKINMNIVRREKMMWKHKHLWWPMLDNNIESV